MKKSRGFMGYLVLLAVFILIAVLLNNALGTTASRRIEYPELLTMIENKQVKAVAIRNESLIGITTNSRVPEGDFPENNYDFETTIGSDFIQTVLTIKANEKKVDVSTLSVADLDFSIIYRAPVVTPWYLDFLPLLLSIGVMVVFWVLIMRQQSGGNSKVMNFGKSKVRMAGGGKDRVTFDDVAGADEEKEELQEMVDFLRNPKAYTAMGARIPKGVLLVGPPGTGKTLLAKAVAGEANVPFFSISGSDFVEMFVGVGASRVRDLFDQAKKAAPSIVFIDEIDAVGRHRGAGLGGGHDEREQTLNQLLVEMDGFAINEGVIVMAATNRRDILDPALLRPGRFDRQVTVNPPDLNGRVAILKVHSKNKPLGPDVDLENVAKRMPFATGAELENVMNEAAILSARSHKKYINQKQLIEAIARVQMGPEKKSHKVTEKDQRLVAYHEAGHAVVGHFTPGCDDVHLVTIVPRGQAAGHTLSLPSEEHDNLSRRDLLARITMTLGGHAAEKLILGDLYTGSASDLKYATELARRMVTQFGMSDNLGTMYLSNDQEVFVGMEFGQNREYSEEIAAQIDQEVSIILEKCYQSAQQMITEHRAQMDALVDALKEYQTVYRAEFVALMNGQPMPERVPEVEKEEEIEKPAPRETETEDADMPEDTQLPPVLRDLYREKPEKDNGESFEQPSVNK